MTIADRGTRHATRASLVDEFRAVVARTGILNIVDVAFGGRALDDGVGLPGGVLTFQAPGDDCAEWMIVAGSSDVDPWIHVDSAPEWVQGAFDVTARPALVAWGQPGRWETSEGRIELEEAGHVAIADLERPWLTDGIADDIAPVLSNEGTREHFREMLPRWEPDVLAIADMDSLSSAAWNALTQPEPTLNRVRSAASLHALHSHVHLLKPEDRGISAALDLVGRLWNEYVPGKPRPLDAVFGPYDIAPRRANIEEKLHNANRQLVWGWAIAAMAEAASGTPTEQRRFIFDSHGLLARENGSWARLVGFDSQRMTITGHDDKSAQTNSANTCETRRYAKPSWAPDLAGSFGGQEAWTVRGFWRGEQTTGPLETMPGMSVLSNIRPSRAPNLPAALADVPDPVNHGAQVEVLGMMQGMQDYSWNGSVLATCPFYGTTPLSYRF